MTLHPPPEIQNGVAPASARADAGRSSKRPTDELTAGSRGRRVAIIRLTWSTVFDRGRRNWFICPRTPFRSPGLLTATPLRAGVARDRRVVAWCDLCRGISAQSPWSQDASARLFVRECGEKAWHIGLVVREQLGRTSKYKIACLRSEQDGHVDVSGECNDYLTVTQQHVCI